jgi:hypothetical protein
VRQTRFEPEQALQNQVANASYLMDSSASITASGSASAPTETWSGGASLTLLPLDGTTAPMNNFASCVGSIDEATQTLKLIPNLYGVFNKSGVPSGFINGLIGFPTQVPIAIDWPTRTLKGNTVNGSWPISGETLKLSWPDTAPMAGTAPSDDDPR